MYVMTKPSKPSVPYFSIGMFLLIYLDFLFCLSRPCQDSMLIFYHLFYLQLVSMCFFTDQSSHLRSDWNQIPKKPIGQEIITSVSYSRHRMGSGQAEMRKRSGSEAGNQGTFPSELSNRFHLRVGIYNWLLDHSMVNTYSKWVEMHK